MTEKQPVVNSNFKKLIAVIAIFVLFVAAYFAADYYLNKEEEVNPEDIFGKIEYLWEENAYEIKSVNYKIGDVEYSIHVGENITIEGYESSVISRSELVQAVTKVSIIPVTRFIDVKKSDYGKYGLENSDKTITITMTDGRTRTLVIGNEVGVDNEYYAMDKENGKACSLSEEYVAEFLKMPEEYRSEIICTLSNVFLRDVTVHKGSTKVLSIVGGAEMGTYEMAYPYAGAEVSQRKINDFLNMFCQLEADAVVEENPADISKYGFGNPLTVFIYDSAEKHTLRFGDKAPEGGVYIMYNDRPVVYRGTCFVYEQFKDVDPISYLEPYVHLYDIENVSSITLTKGSVSCTASISGDVNTATCKVNGKTVDANSFKNAFRALISVTYGKVESANGSNYLTVTFTMKDGSVKTYTYRDANKDYCVVRSSWGYDCMVLKSLIDNAFNNFQTLAQ